MPETTTATTGASASASSTVALNTSSGIYDYNESAYTVANGDKTSIYDIPSSNLLKGGQWGFLPLIGDKDNKHAWMADQAYIRRDIIPIVLQVPKGFELLPNGEYFKLAAKALIEKHARTIEGLDSSLTVNVGEHELGLDGATYQEPVNVTRAASNVTISLTERYGQAVKNLLDVWIRFLIMDPDTKQPLIAQWLKSGNDGSLVVNNGSVDIPINKNVWSTEYYTMTCLFIEPDILNARVNNAWLVSNMFPRAVPNIIGKKDKKADKEIEELSIELGGFAIHSSNLNVRKMAQDFLDKLQLYKLTNDHILPPAKEVDSTLESDKSIYFDQTHKTDNVSGPTATGWNPTE